MRDTLPRFVVRPERWRRLSSPAVAVDSSDGEDPGLRAQRGLPLLPAGSSGPRPPACLLARRWPLYDVMAQRAFLGLGR